MGHCSVMARAMLHGLQLRVSNMSLQPSADVVQARPNWGAVLRLVCPLVYSLLFQARYSPLLGPCLSPWEPPRFYLGGWCWGGEARKCAHKLTFNAYRNIFTDRPGLFNTGDKINIANTINNCNFWY
jgi:hypothetical protein